MCIPLSLPHTNTLPLLLVYQSYTHLIQAFTVLLSIKNQTGESLHHLHSTNTCTFPSLLTGVVFTADAGVPSLSAGAHPPIQAGVGVTQVDLRLAVITRESNWAAAAQACDGVDGPKQDGGRGDERGGAVEAQHGDALHVVLARLTQANVVVERENLE